MGTGLSYEMSMSCTCNYSCCIQSLSAWVCHRSRGPGLRATECSLKQQKQNVRRHSAQCEGTQREAASNQRLLYLTERTEEFYCEWYQEQCHNRRRDFRLRGVLTYLNYKTDRHTKCLLAKCLVCFMPPCAIQVCLSWSNSELSGAAVINQPMQDRYFLTLLDVVVAKYDRWWSCYQQLTVVKSKIKSTSSLSGKTVYNYLNDMYLLEKSEWR